MDIEEEIKLPLQENCGRKTDKIDGDIKYLTAYSTENCHMKVRKRERLKMLTATPNTKQHFGILDSPVSNSASTSSLSPSKFIISSKSSKSNRLLYSTLLLIFVFMIKPIQSEFHTPKLHKTSVDYMKSRGASSSGFTVRKDITSAVVTGDPRILLISSDENLYEVNFEAQSTGQVRKYRK